jgi:hypothetical protein
LILIKSLPTLISNIIFNPVIISELIPVLLTTGSDIKIRRLVELQEAEGEKCVIIGTLYVDQHLKPSILKEISEEVL